MLFEFVEGGELFSRIRMEGRLAVEVARFYLSQVIMVLSHLHEREIMYRDIKPENLLIDSRGYIKVTDFGFAKSLEGQADRTYTLCGTPEYLAPEIIQSGKKGYGKSVDWWSLGVLLFEMVVGYPPFADKSPILIYKKIVSGRVTIPSWVEPSASDLITKLLTLKVEKRLGCNDNGKAIMTHQFFDGFSFEKVL